MLLRVGTALVLIPLVVVLVWWGPPELVAAVAGLVAIAALIEFFSLGERVGLCLLYTSPSPRDPKTSRMPSSA